MSEQRFDEMVRGLRAALDAQKAEKPARTCDVHIRLSEVERVLLEGAATQSGMTISDYVRVRLFEEGK